MVYSMDPEIYTAMKPMLEAMKDQPKIPLGDVNTRRTVVVPMLDRLLGGAPFPSDVTTADYYATAADGHKILCRWYTKKDAPTTPGPAIVHAHGGGMILGSIQTFHTVYGTTVSKTGVPMLAVDYRLAPEHPHPTLVEDSYAGLTFIHEHAAELKVDPARIAVMGESAGGGIAAGVALMARDRNLTPPLAKQILIYPMLDDRNVVPDPNIEPFAFWTYEDNVTGWKALLGDKFGTDHAEYYAAPARAKDVSRLPSTYIDVGQLDIFLYEDLEYARRISMTGTDVEFRLHPGAPHAFEGLAPLSGVSKRANEDRLRVIKSL